MRKAAASAKPSFVITKEGNTWKFKLVSAIRTDETVATEGVEFEKGLEINRTIFAYIILVFIKINQKEDAQGKKNRVIIIL